MKIFIISVLTLFLNADLTAQKILGSQLPKAVTATFIQKFPDVRRASWRKNGATEYKAKFILNDAKTATIINEQGDVLKTETKIKISELPALVTTGINSKYPKAKFVAATRIESIKEGILYKADIKTGKKNFDVFLSDKGIFKNN